MGKSATTLLITNLVFDYLYLKRGYRVGMEVAVPNRFGGVVYGRCDLLGYHATEKEIICVEVKISLSDFKSKNGHNLVGNKNYYAVPLDLVDKIKDLVPKHVGIIAVDTIHYSVGKRTRWYNLPRVIKQSKYQELSSDSIANLVKSLATAQTSNILLLLRQVRTMNEKGELELI